MGAGASRLPAEWLGFFRFDFNVEPAGIVSQITFVETRIAFLWAITVVTFRDRKSTRLNSVTQ